MHIVTFYSFKGGTGRSMALANIAALLLQKGRRILLVDFDLEAPGLDTFLRIENPEIGLGIVDFVNQYLANGAVPEIESYIHECDFKGVTDGRLWLMPAGRQDDGYDSRFKSIDWEALYRYHDGFLLFEDIKVQWEQKYQPDYVLIDSRTGHTDVGGICTRQLPDAVVAMFLPTHQNLRGLHTIVDGIRMENSLTYRNNIQLHFVMANVPDLDDEDEILSEACRKSKEALGYDNLAGTIHHFNSLALLEQSVFVVDRPRSKLSAEYGQLCQQIVRSNVEDKDGALAYLDEVLASLRIERDLPPDDKLEDRLKLISAKLSYDDEVLRRLARIRRAQRRTEEAASLYEQLMQVGIVDAETLTSHAELTASLGHSNAALLDLSRLFLLPRVSVFSLNVALKLKLQLDPDGLQELVHAPSIEALDSRGIFQVVSFLQEQRQTVRIAADIAKSWLSKHGDKAFILLRNAYILCLIGSGQFNRAIEEISKANATSDLATADAFNLAAAHWGRLGEPPTELFQKIVTVNGASDESLDANYSQCMSLASWVTGDKEKALFWFSDALRIASSTKGKSFSAWSFLNLSAERFIDDLYEMKGAIEGFSLKPRFIIDNEKR